MAKRIKTKYTGVFYRETVTNGKTDKIYYIVEPLADSHKKPIIEVLK